MKTLYLVILTPLLSLPALADNTPTFRLNAGTTEPLSSSNANGDGFYNQLSAEIFKRLNIKLTFIRLPSQRALIHANKGIDDANIARIKGLEKKWPNIIRVPESVITWEFTAFIRGQNTKINGWNSLKSYSVGHMNGWQIYEKKAAVAKKVIKSNSPRQLFELLKNGRIDLALFERSQAPYWFNKLKYSARPLTPPLAVKPLYIYVHKKHKNLVPKMAKVISEIKQDGTYQKIFDRTLKFKK